MASLEEKAYFLDKIHLFRRMDEDTLFNIADCCDEVSFSDGEVILQRGVPAEAFYLIYKGHVRIDREGRGQKNITLTRGDYFGVDALLPHERSNPNATAVGDVVLLRLSKQNFATLKKGIPHLKDNLQISVKGQHLTRKKHFDWVREDEVIYFLVRKHPSLLVKGLLLPFILLFAVGYMWKWLLSQQNIPTVAYVAAGLFSFFWLLLVLWRWEDWRNDYYIVTNQRVIWLEKVIGLYDSRQEAPLEEVLSVGAEVDFWGRFFDYGQVNVRTYVGNIHLRYVNHPYQARHIIDEMAARQKAEVERKEKEDLIAAIRKRLHQPEPAPVKQRKKPEDKKTPKAKEQRSKKRSKVKVGRLQLRYEEGKTITYRKHWVVLVRQAGLPAFLCAAFMLLTGFQLVHYFFPPAGGAELGLALAVLYGFFAAVFLFWTLYQYVDWSNDIFQVTDDKIFDIDRTPLGNVESRSAPLENIHSTEYKQVGLLPVFFNYGTVYIEIGTADFAFEDVKNPSEVQQDIDRRRMKHIEKKKKKEIKDEQERMIDWLVAYHQSSEEFRNTGQIESAPPVEADPDDESTQML